MNCPRCEHENPPRSKFCLECGTRLAARCRSCGTERPAGAKFCNACGETVAATASSAALPASYHAMSASATGKREQACEHLTTAMTMNREMDLRYGLDQAEAGIG